MIDDLHRRALALGVHLEYEDVDGVVRPADDEVVRRVVEVLEADRAASPALVDPVFVAAASPDPGAVTVDARLDDASLLVDGSPLPVVVRRDGDRSVVEMPDSLPYGCHTLGLLSGARADECLVVVRPSTMPGLDPARRWSGLFVPTYALWETGSPLPSFGHLGAVARRLGSLGIDMVSTLPLYAAFLDDPYDPSPYSPISRLHWNEVFIDDPALPPLPVPAQSDTVDWRALGARRRRQLVRAAKDADRSLLERLDRFVTAHPDVAAYARFRSAREGGDDGGLVERSHVLAQLLCDEQLHTIGSSTATASLALDLPIGSHPDGYETWAFPDLFAPAMAVGAPPDTFFTSGQNWGFPPQLPGEMRRTGYELWRRMIERAGRHAAMLRIDHVMAVHRLWWVPDGFPADRGVYVGYPRDELLAVIAAGAAEAGVAIVGENLGTVPPDVVQALDDVGMLGMYEEQFMTDRSPLPVIPARTVAGVRTHDMSAFAEHVRAHDLTGYRTTLGVDETASAGELLDAVLSRLAHSDARMVVADLDDLIGETRPHNLPGRVVEGIWQRRLDRPASEILADPDVLRRLDILTGRR